MLASTRIAILLAASTLEAAGLSHAGPIVQAAQTKQTEDGEQAQDGKQTEDRKPPRPTTLPRIVPTVAALVPGLALHGFGHFVAGDRKTAYRLLAWQGIGLGVMVASGATLALSGASRYGNEITIPALIAGSGIFLTTAVADIYGSATGGRTFRFTPPPTISATAGYGYIDDPQFDYDHFSILSARLTRESFAIEPELWTALGADNQRARLPLQYRFGDKTNGDYLQAETAATYHRYGDDGFASSIAEMSLAGRMNGSTLSSSLAGSFATATLGYAMHRTSYEVPDVEADTIGLLLASFGYGLYLPNRGQIEGYYAHRRDGYSAGLSPSSRNGSGFLGHFGLALRQPITSRFAISARSEIGAAWVSTLGLEVRGGTTP